MKFSLESLNELRLSQNAKCVLESCHIPNITNLTNHVVYVRLCASSQDKTYDTTKKLNGNPILVSTIIHNTSVSSNVIFNATDSFYSLRVSPNFLSNGYIELELECPTASNNIDFITNTPLKGFY